jgi:ribosomal protein S18 acetylase RimI-like enzyme
MANDTQTEASRLIDDYEAGTDLVRAAVAGLTAEQFRLRPVAGLWSTLEVLCHVADCEQFFADRMKRTLAMDRPLLVGADGWRYPEAVRYHDRDPDEELALVALTRRQVARILRLVPPGAWDRPAVHTESGLVTLRGLLRHAVEHLAHHVAFIVEKRRALAAAPTIRPATSAADVEACRRLFREYADSLGFDLCFQSFEQELADLPGRYAPPSGRLLLATVGGEPAGCVALKPLGDGACEMKRLYVRPAHRGLKLGRALAEAVIREAAALGYAAMRLDTVPSVMGSAVGLYRSLGFRDIPPYCVNPIPGALYLERRLVG